MKGYGETQRNADEVVPNSDISNYTKCKFCIVGGIGTVHVAPIIRIASEESSHSEPQLPNLIVAHRQTQVNRQNAQENLCESYRGFPVMNLSCIPTVWNLQWDVFLLCVAMQIFLFCRLTATQMTFGFVFFKQPVHLRSERRVDLRQLFTDILVYRGLADTEV